MLSSQKRSRRATGSGARSCVSAMLLLALLSLAGSAQAALPTPLRPDREQRLRLTLVGELQLGKLEEDLFLSPTFQLHSALRLPQLGCAAGAPRATCRTALEVALQAPLRLRVHDAAPEQSGVLRSQDWDEARDLFRLLRFLRYGEPGSPLEFSVGELNDLSLLQGAALSHYFNVVNPDHVSPGVRVQSATRVQSSALFLDDLSAPQVVGGSVTWRPGALFWREKRWLERLGVGGSVVGDLSAPVRLQAGDDGLLVVDDTSSPTVLESRATFIGGPLLEAWLVAREQWSVVARGEVLWHGALGRGEHVGMSVQWDGEREVSVQLGVQAIWAHERYVPRYFSSLYEVERFQMQGLGAALPQSKLQVVSQLAPRQDVYYAPRLSVALPGLRTAFGADLLLARHTPQGDALTLFLQTQPIEQASLRAFYHQNFFSGISQALSAERSLFGAELRLLPWGPFFVAARYNRRWRLRDDGAWASIQDWGVGVGAQAAFGLR